MNHRIKLIIPLSRVVTSATIRVTKYREEIILLEEIAVVCTNSVHPFFLSFTNNVWIVLIKKTDKAIEIRIVLEFKKIIPVIKVIILAIIYLG